jgi:Family of unknown function (DUF5995)
MSNNLAGPSSDTPTTVPEVIARLDIIQSQAETQDERGPRDGLACFNYLYRSITQEILNTLEEPDGFEDRTFLARLDVEFAKRYLHALDLYHADPDTAPRSWRVLLDRRADSGIAPLQFAIAGVNAHVNLDLAFALVSTCEALESPLGADTQRLDYQRVNQVFATQMTTLRHHFEDLLERDLDRSEISSLNTHLDDLAVVLTRDGAWHHAEHLWSVRMRPKALLDREETTDVLVSLAGRGILSRL